MAPTAMPSLLAVAALALALPGAAALRSQQQERAAGHPRGLPDDRKLRCIARSEVAVGGEQSTSSAERRADRPLECRGWPQDLASKYMGTKDLPLNGTWWKGGTAGLYLPKRSDFEQALQPIGYAGARRRLRRFMLSLLSGEPVEVAVLGGSVTCGSDSDASWPQLFEEHMRTLGHTLTVHNLAKPSTGSEYAANNIVYASPELNRSSLVIIDTSINDDRDGLRDTYDFLVQQLLELPHHPAVIDLATRHAGKALGEEEVYCSTSLSDFTHWRAEAFQLPMVSFPDAMCRCCGSTGLWFGKHHPNATTHDAIARTLVGAFGVEMERTCTPRGLDVRDHPSSSLALQTAPFAHCLRSQPKTNVDFTTFHEAAAVEPFVQRHDGWKFARDLPRKPFGWLVPAGSQPGEEKIISFKVNVSKGGWVRLDYLATYTDMGTVRCWAEGVSSRLFGCDISGVLVGDYSAVRSAYIGLTTELSTQLLHCRSMGGKFKILGVTSC